MTVIFKIGNQTWFFDLAVYWQIPSSSIARCAERRAESLQQQGRYNL
jgi:hypothetical protein